MHCGDMQDFEAGDPVTQYLEKCGIRMPLASDEVLRRLVEDLFAFYGTDQAGEHVAPAQPFLLDEEDPDYTDFLVGDAEEREQILERRIILRFGELMHIL